MGPKPSSFIARRKLQTRAEIEQDIRRLGDDELAGFEKRGRKWRPRAALVVDEFHHRRLAGLALARDIDVAGAAFFQCQADELAAPLDGRPVVKLVAHQSTAIFDVAPCLLKTPPAASRDI